MKLPFSPGAADGAPRFAPLSAPALYSRRSFLAAASASALAAVTGCATNPVSGRRELNFFNDAEIGRAHV